MTEQIINISPDIYLNANIGIQRLVIDQVMHHGAVRRPSTKDYFFVYSPQRSYFADETGEAMHPAHSWVCWGPEHDHIYGHDEKTWTHSCFHVHGDGARQLFQQIPMNRCGQINNPKAFTAALHLLFICLSESETYDEALITSCLQSIIQLCRQQASTQTPSDLVDTWRYLKQHYREQHSLDSLAERVHCSVASLRQRFKAHYNVTLIEHLINVRMQEAQYLLLHSEIPINDIAKNVGYDDPAYFSRLIKKHFGHSPRALRSGQDPQA